MKRTNDRYRITLTLMSLASDNGSFEARFSVHRNGRQLPVANLVLNRTLCLPGGTETLQFLEDWSVAHLLLATEEKNWLEEAAREILSGPLTFRLAEGGKIQFSRQ